MVGVLLLQAGCEQMDVTTVEVTRVELSPPETTVSVQEVVRLNATVLGNGGRALSGRAIDWTSLDPDIAAVAQDGAVTGVGPGVATIRATSEGVSGSATVHVTAGPAIRLTPADVEFVGVQNGASPGDRTISVANAGGGTLGALTAGIRHTSGPAGWLAASVSSPTAPASVVLSVNQAGLPAGTYLAAVDVASPHASNSPATVTVRLTVLEPQPAIGLGATSVSFAGAQGGASPAQQTVGVTNAGRGTLSGLSVAVEYAAGQPAGWLDATLSGTTAPATLTLRATTGSLAAGTYAANVRLASDVAQNSPQIVTVSFTVGAAQPVIVREPAQLAFAGRAGDPPPPARSVEIGNAGGGTLSGLSAVVTYSAGQPDGWLDASLSGTAAPATLTVRPTTSTLPPGTYAAVIHISADGAVNSPQTVPVTFEVTAAAAAIAVSPAAVNFAATRTGSDPAAAQVSIANSGGGELIGLTSTISYPQGQPSGWLSAELSGGTAPATLTLRAARGSLAVGTWTATVRVAALGAANSPVDVAVTLTITEAAATSPSAPAGLAATAVSTSRIDVAWSAATGTVTTYRLERKTGAAGAWALVETLSGTTLGLQDTGRSAATTYVYRVQACNGDACSPYSAEAAATTQAPAPAAPAAPTGLAATAVSTSRIDVAWSAATGTVTTYRLERKTGAAGAWALVETLSGTTLGFQDTGRSAATTYVYRVQACNGDACSPYSAEASATTQSPLLAPPPPTGLSAVGVSTSRIDLAWSHTGLPLVDGFEIQRAPQADPNAFVQVASTGAAARSYADTGLPAGTGFLYRVRACNPVGCSGWAQTSAATQAPVVVPGVPSNVSVTVESRSQVTLRWSAPGGQARYEIQRRSGRGGPWTFSAEVPGNATSFSDTGLTGGTYQYQIRACAVECSAFSEPVTASLGGGEEGDPIGGAVGVGVARVGAARAPRRRHAAR